MLRENWMKSWIGRSAWLLILALAATTAIAYAQTVPSVVVSQQTTVAATGLTNAGKVVQDTCGNLYELEDTTGLLEIPAGGGAAITLANYTGVSNAGDGTSGGLAIDSNNNLYVDSKWNGYVWQIPSTNCVPNPGAAVKYANAGSGLGNTWGFYWYDPGDIAVNAAGTVFIAANSASNTIIALTSLQVPYLILAPNSLAQVESIAADAAGDVFFTLKGSGDVYEITVANYGTTSPTVLASGLSTALGLSFDAAGNLFVGDSQAGSIYEIPYNSAASALDGSSMFLVASGVPLGTPLTVGIGANSVFYSNNGSSIYQQVLGAASFGSVAVGSSGTATADVAFNAAVTPATIGFVTSGGVFAPAAGGTCAAATAYTAGSSCTVDASFAPAAPGLATGALVLADSHGAPLATANLSGTGLGAGLTIDPGTVSAIGTGYKTPMSVALDVAGDLFIADSGAGKVWEIAAGSATPVSIGNGLSSPEGVAVDGTGDLYIADTGNSRIVEIPVVNGALSASSQTTVLSGSASIAGNALSKPAGLSVDVQGNLYIADTGNNRIVYLPYNGGWDPANAITLGSGWSAPLATTVTASGLIYIADSGSGKIYSLPYASSALGQAVVATGFSNPSALATDAAGDLFVVDQGNMKVMRIPNVAGSLAIGSSANVSFGIENPYGLAIDSVGNLYVSDNVNAAAYMLARTQTTLSFGNLNPGTTSSPASVQVESSGNQALTLGSPYYVATGSTNGFTLDTSETNACSDGDSLAVGLNCVVEATFAPPTGGTFSDVLTLSSSASNTAAPQVTLAGTGEAVQATATTLTVTAPSGTPYYGEAIALSASVTSDVGTPTGTVALMVDGSQVATSTLNNGTVTFALSNGLAGGSHALQAVYQGATTTTIVYAGSDSAIDTIVVGQVATATSISFATANLNPSSQPAGSALMLTATVISTFAGIPTGTVTFTITDSGGTTVTPSAPLMAASGGVFQATYSYTPSSPATGVAFDVVAVSASYGGDGNFNGSSSAVQSFDVAPASGSVVLTTSGTLIDAAVGSSSSVTFTNTSYGGWQGVVGYQCVASSLPANAICVFSPGQVSVMASTPGVNNPPVTTQLTVVINNPPNSPAQSSMLWWLGGLSGLLLFRMRRRIMRGAWGTVAMVIGIALLAISASGLTACNSGGVQFSSPKGTSTITVVASIDPYVSPMVSPPVTQACGIDPTTNAGSPALAPCSQPSFQITLDVE